MPTLPLSRRTFLAAGGAILAAPSLARAGGAKLDRLVLQSPPSGPSIVMSQAVATGAFDDIAKEVDFSLWNTGDELRANLSSGKVEVAIIPTQSGASLYNRGFPIRLVNVVTDGHCGLFSTGARLNSFADLKGKTVAQPFYNDFTGHVMRALLAKHGIADQVELIPAATHVEAAQLLLSGRTEAAILAEPAGTAAMMKAKKAGQTITMGVRTRDEWALVSGAGSALPQAGLGVTAGFAEAHPAHVEALHAALAGACQAANSDPATAAAHTATLTERPAPLIQAALPHCALHVRPASEARADLEGTFKALLAADPGILAGKLPDDGYYLL
ncbi:ABC transporter substrate-binding protein [Mesobacterium sp. TK19101]|uniref:ABC transporter substrate-binding protein n=1 Tax=Mesobacterium hydrothermale TaxID=3111907 RepID=A0ABU6HF71_9RHOB|nr:ABC transporter substrate-binding protein [Mesobacterium sp. TK19101]MEC3860951.1 ABC transporter substrate-binding protein [Mesobacterium sp. TK19101]